MTSSTFPDAAIRPCSSMIPRLHHLRSKSVECEASTRILELRQVNAHLGHPRVVMSPTMMAVIERLQVPDARRLAQLSAREARLGGGIGTRSAVQLRMGPPLTELAEPSMCGEPAARKRYYLTPSGASTTASLACGPRGAASHLRPRKGT
jgi:hypothetical protein